MWWIFLFILFFLVALVLPFYLIWQMEVEEIKKENTNPWDHKFLTPPEAKKLMQDLDEPFE